jgi:hypothetical protein
MKRSLCSAALLIGAVVACGDRQRAADPSLERATRNLVGFLRGELPFDSRALADTVELRIAPEGGGAVSRVSRDSLRERSAWTVAGPARRFQLVPPATFSTVSTKVGRHFNCQEQDLATRAPDLASRPHVGVRLQPEGAQSCLQSWNATFVFDTAGGSPRLIAVLYDQWEW